jgi:hypothetical protein
VEKRIKRLGQRSNGRAISYGMDRGCSTCNEMGKIVVEVDCPGLKKAIDT